MSFLYFDTKSTECDMKLDEEMGFIHLNVLFFPPSCARDYH